eukprot:ANDGO_08243.mRNA.1 Poly(A)-specific ribonuclease PARN
MQRLCRFLQQTFSRRPGNLSYSSSPMDFTRENFSESIPLVKMLLAKAEYVAFDLEMTGISLNTRDNAENGADYPEQRYRKMRQVATTYSVIQFGICFFVRNPSADGGSSLAYTATPLNFWAYPEQISEIKYFPRRVIDVGTSVFLKDNHMDFQKWITQGIPFLSRPYRLDFEKYLFNSLGNFADSQTAINTYDSFSSLNGFWNSEQGKDKAEKESLVLSKPEDIEIFDASVKAITEWDRSSQLVLPAASAYVRKAVYDWIEKNCSRSQIKTESVALDEKIPWQKSITITAIDESVLREERLSMARKAFEQKCGLSLIVWLVMQSGVPVVGHNCFFDWLFTMNDFEQPLPDSLSEFKHAFSKLVKGSVFDTKLLSQEIEPLAKAGTALGDLHRILQTYQKVQIDPSSANPESSFPLPPANLPVVSVTLSSSYQSEKLHEAAYDAYLTGCVFAHLSHRLFPAFSLSISDFRNRINMMRSLFSVQMDSIDDPVYEKGTLLCVQLNQDKDTTTDLILSFFGQEKSTETRTIVEQKHGRVSLRWIDQSRVILILHDVLPTDEARITRIVEEAQRIAGPLMASARSFDDYRRETEESVVQRKRTLEEQRELERSAKKNRSQPVLAAALPF